MNGWIERNDVAALVLAGVGPAGVTPVPVETPRGPPNASHNRLILTLTRLFFHTFLERA